MKWLLIFGIPLAALSVGSWAAWQVLQPPPGPSEAIVMMLPGGVPALNPFLPANEAERQMLDLLHEPLIRLDGQGRLAPGLAETWAWHQRVTCWFPTLEALRAAQRRLAEVPEVTRQVWELEEVTTEGLALMLRFAKPGAPAADEVLKTIAEYAPLPLTFLRLASSSAAKAVLEDFARDANHSAVTMRVWFDEDGACELVTTRSSLLMREALSNWLRQKGQSVPRITILAEVTGLLEPLLDMEMNANTAAWPDGAPVTAADVRATVAHVKNLGYPVQGREGFRHIQSISPLGSNGVRVVYRRRYGSALAAWVGFPILPESWLKQHPQGAAEPPPGAGAWRIGSQSPGQITLVPRARPEAPSSTSLHAVAAVPPLQAQVALATGTLDVVWPAADSEWHRQPRLDLHPTPPRNRLLVLLNTRSAPLSELPVREALAQALDRPPLLSERQGGHARPAEVLFQPGLWYAPKPSGPAFDLAAACQTLEQAGWLKDVSGRLKKGGQSLDFEILVTQGNLERERLARQLAMQWAHLGAHIQVRSIPPEDLLPLYLEPGKFDAVLLGLDYELAWDKTAFWHSAQREGGLNFTQLADPQLDLLLEALADEFDTAQLAARAQALQERFTALQPALPLIGDLQQMGLRHARFPQLEKPDLQRPLTLRALFGTGSQQHLQMRPPRE